MSQKVTRALKWIFRAVAPQKCETDDNMTHIPMSPPDNFKNNINDKLKRMTYNDGHIGYDIYKYLVEF